jgi:hypothetical protein
MKGFTRKFLIALALSAVLVAPSFVLGAYMCPDGSYVSQGPCTMCPDGSFVAGTRCEMTPDGRYVGR